MRLQMRRINHQARWLAGLARQFGKYLVEHTEAAPAHEPVIDCLVRTIAERRIAPAQTISDDEDDAADDPPVVNPRNPSDNGKYGSIRRICASDSSKRSVMATPPSITIRIKLPTSPQQI